MVDFDRHGDDDDPRELLASAWPRRLENLRRQDVARIVVRRQAREVVESRCGDSVPELAN